MAKEQIKDHFKKQASDYVGLMKRLVPDYEAGQKLMCDLIPFQDDQQIKVLDLGAGSGLLSELVLKKYPRAEVHAFDLTKEMLAVCEENLKQFKDRLIIKQGDYAVDSFGSLYDVVLAGLTLHHLPDLERQKVFKKLYQSLNPHGVFIAREIIIDEDPSLNDEQYALWLDFMESQGEDSSYWLNKHKEKDHPASVSKQLSWLQESGFTQTTCHWKQFNFAIISGKKQKA